MERVQMHAAHEHRRVIDDHLDGYWASIEPTRISGGRDHFLTTQKSAEQPEARTRRESWPRTPLRSGSFFATFTADAEHVT